MQSGEQVQILVGKVICSTCMPPRRFGTLPTQKVAAMNRPKLGRWELYKAAQEEVVNWLTKHVGDIVGCKAIFKARELLDLAKAVAKSALAVPQEIMDLLQDVIAGRQSQADWHSSRQSSSTIDNESHQWFIQLLINVRDILLPFVSGTPKPSVHLQDTDTQSVKDHLANVFSLLEIEEPSTSPLGTQPVQPKKTSAKKSSPTTSPRKQSQTPSPKLEADGMGADFALWCHIKDMADVREFIKQAWIEYSAGVLSIVLVSQLTEVGIGLMRLEDEKFVAKYPEFKDWWALLAYFGLEAYGSGKTTYIKPLNSSSRADSRNEDLIELICPAAAFLLRDTRDQMMRYAKTPEGKLTLRKGKLGILPDLRLLEPEAYDFCSILEVQAPELLAWITDYKSQAKRPSRQIFERTEFLAGIAEYYDAKIAPTWLVMACAIHIDMYEIIGDKPGVVSKAWVNATKDMKQQLDTASEYFVQSIDPEHPVAKWKAELAPIFKRSESHEHALFVTQEGLDYQTSRNLSQDESKLGQATSSVMGSPCISGAALWSDRMAYHKVGIRFANLEFTTFALASLYTAATKAGLLKPTWEDMHFLTSVHKSKSPLVPKSKGLHDSGSFFRQYLLSLGLPIAQVSKYTSRDHPKHKFVMDNCRKDLAPTSEYVIALTESWHANDKLGTFDRGDLVEMVLTKLTAQSNGSKKKNNGTKREPHYTVKEVLTTFKTHMIADEPHLNFDYPGFHMLCERIRCALNDLFPSCKNHAIGMALWEQVFHILRDAINTSKGESLLGKAAAILQNLVIDRPGVSNKFSKEARNASSGGIPKDLAPQIRPYNPAWTAELWQYFAGHRHGMRDMNLKIASFSASHMTFYDPEGSKVRFDCVVVAAEQCWRIWRLVRIKKTWKDAQGVEQVWHTFVEVQRKGDGKVVNVPVPATVRSLGLRGLEGAGIAFMEQSCLSMERMANESWG